MITCPDCRQSARKLHSYVGRVICAECKLAAQDAERGYNDASLDDPRHGQATGINNLRRVP